MKITRRLRFAALDLSPLATTAIVVSALILALWVSTWQRARLETDQAIAAATRANSNLAIAYEENAADAIGDVDQLLRVLAAAYRDEGPSVAASVVAWSPALAQVRGLAVAREDGWIVVATGDVAFADASRRDDFAFHRRSATRELHIGHPERLPSSGAPMVAMSRRVNKPDGSFGGIVLAMVDPSYFIRFRARADLGAHGIVSLVGRDGISLARQSHDASTYGDDMRPSTLWAHAAASPSGAFASEGELDGTRRLMSYRVLAQYPAIVMVGTALDETLEPARERNRLYYLLAALASNVIVLLAVAMLRSLARQKRDFEAIAAAEARLRASEAHTRTITENMAGGVVTVGREGTILSVNSPMCRMYGYDAEEMVGQHITKLEHESGRARIAAIFAELNARAGDFKEDGREFLSIRKDGSLFEVEVLISSLAMDRQRTYIGIVHDISGRKKMERALRASEARYRATFNQALVGIVHTNLQGRFIQVNPTACGLLGYSEQEMLALGYRDVTHPEDLAVSAARHDALLRDPKGRFEHHVTRRFLRKDGSIMWALCSVGVIRRDDGIPDYFLTMVQDITELKRVEQVKDEFVSTVSHELRTPLTSIGGSLGLLAGGLAGALPQAARELVTIAENNCKRLIRLVNDILDTEKIDSGKLRFDLRVTAVEPLIERAVESMEGFALAHGVPLRASAPGEPVYSNVDADRFIQVLTNLISNAVTFSPPGTPVEIALSREGSGAARIEVRDCGPGISREFQARIFQRFSQADSSVPRQKGGTGLGLCIAKAIVEGMGGAIGLRTAPGEGTTFFVTLPASTQTAIPPVEHNVAEEARP